MITRDNYEEFFLLYIDNELSVADREAVEQFVAHHPDLQEDWKALLHCRLLPDEEIIFPDREALYGIGALEEEDNNLPRFSPDLSIVFPDKASLYKKEEDKRIIWLPWLRVGIAAATLGIVAMLVLVVKNNKIAPAVTPVASGTLHSIGSGAARPADDRAAAHPVMAARLTTDKPMKEKVKVKTSGQDVRQEKELISRDLAQQTAPNDVQQVEPRDAVHEAAQGRPTDITATRAAAVTATKAAVAATDVTTANIRSSDAVAALQTGIPRDQSSFATEALRENENHDPENNILVADESPAPGKGKLRGLFRKVTRTFGKTADRDNDGQREVLVGAFQISLK